MITLDQALAIRRKSVADESAPHGRVYDVGDGWWIGFGQPVIGSGGVVIDRSDGHSHWLGSAMGQVVWMFAHRCGFRHRRYVWEITAVRSEYAVRRLLSRLRYDTPRLRFDRLPLTLEFTWLGYDHLEEIARADYIDYTFTVTECDDPTCAHIGSRIPEFRHMRRGQGYEADFAPDRFDPWATADIFQ